MSELSDHYKPSKVESSVKQYWDKSNVYQRVKRQREDNEDFYFLDGPPFTSGRMHCGTAWGKIIKDSFLRYYRMNGYNVLDRPGYDTHGLPIEVKVEQQNDFDTKQDILEYGLKDFVDECKQYAEHQKSVMDEEFKDMGIWMDWDNPYVTMNKDYMDSVWSAFKKLYDMDLIGRGSDVLNTCPRCQTTLSDSELDYGNRTIESAYIGFEATEMDAYLVTWTTTPWTVIGNQFIAIDKESEYAFVEHNSDMYVVADECVESFTEATGFESYSIVKKVNGEEIVGLEYEHPLSEFVNSLPSRTGAVYHADYVETEKTGLVHSAPGFGHEDYERGQELDLDVYSPVKQNGKFTEEAGKFCDMYVHNEGTEEVLNTLDCTGNLVAVENYTHEYPECPRCDTDVVFQATKQWFFKSTKMKDGLQSAIDDTDWFPQQARDERFRNTVENAPDWNISRQRYWGTPIPVWECEECGENTIVGSSEELQNLSDTDEVLDDLHRPTVDTLTIPCSECNSESHRVEDVLDVWFDSSVASWGSTSTLPEENPNPNNWPSDLIIEGQDQTRGWFLMQLYIGVALSGEAPYKDVLMHGFAMLDSEPMSKSRGHVLRPLDVINEYGRDAMRGYMLSNEAQENDVNMTSDMQGVESMKKNLDIVWNIYRFSLMYMREDSYQIDASLQTTRDQRTTLDNWILSRLDKVIEDATIAFNNREPYTGLQSIMEFLLDDVSRYYIKNIRDRVWVTEDTENKISAYDTLGTILYESCRLLAPFTPYISEELYDNLPTKQHNFSVHNESWPSVHENRDEKLEADIKVLRRIEQATSRCRDKAGRKQRWPLLEVTVVSDDSKIRRVVDEYGDLLENRLNTYGVSTKEEYENTDSVLIPLMKRIGPKFKQHSNEVAELVEGTKPTRLPIHLNIEDNNYKITKEQVEIREKLPENIEATEFSGGRVYVNTKVTDAVKMEGITRDIIRRAQQMRSEINLDMDEKVALKVESESDIVLRSVDKNKEYIIREVRVDQFGLKIESQNSKEFTVDGDRVALHISVD